MIPGAGSNVVFTLPVASLHSHAADDAPVVTQGIAGETAVVEEVDVTRSWLRLRLTHDGYPGWVPVGAVCPGTWPPAQATAVCVRSLSAHLYQGPDVKTPLLASLPIGTVLAVEHEEEKWTRVSRPGSAGEWIQSGALRKGVRAEIWDKPTALRESLAATALRFLGLPYRWGGTTPWGIDCSGFVQLLFRLHGIVLPRDAHQQAASARLVCVDPDNLAVADLVFFDRRRHVGLAISGNSFIHATTHREPVVQISALTEPHWAGVLEEIKRLNEFREQA